MAKFTYFCIINTTMKLKSTDREILAIALPAIVSNITVPLLGLVDVAIVGHLGAAAYIGAIAVGGMLFNIIYWLFGFLRMGTGGMTSQAFGGDDFQEVMRIFVRAIGIGLLVALCLIALQIPIRHLAFFLVQPTAEVEALTTTYFHICIWGAPPMLGLYGLTGWFIGMQNTKIPMWIAIVQNIVNIVASLALVYGLGMKVEGVALGTLIAQYAGFAMGLALWTKNYGNLVKTLRGTKGRLDDTNAWLRECFRSDAMKKFFSVNRDIFLRTLCLVSVTMFFTSAGASQGEIILAVNTLLMQLFTLYSYIMDGFAYAGEAICGKYIGARNALAYSQTIRRLFLWGVIMSALFTLTYATGGSSFLALLTDEPQVILASSDYFFWALLIPFSGMAAFIWDGVYIGATATRGMLISMATATLCFFVLYFALRPILANHALWLAFLSYLLVRGIMQTVLHDSLHS